MNCLLRKTPWHEVHLFGNLLTRLCSHDAFCSCRVHCRDISLMHQGPRLPTDLLKSYYATTIFCTYSGILTQPKNHRCHNPMIAKRIGEALHPGPESSILACLINPTAVTNKKELLLSLDADLVALAETSATPIIQQEFSQSIRASEHKMWWGCPVDDKVKHVQSLEHVPSRRGEALGTAIMTRIPTRAHRLENTDVLWQSCRFNACVCTFGHWEVLVVCMYFFPGRTTEAQTKNNTLLMQAYDFVNRSSMPFLIAADFNQKIQNLTAWSAFEAIHCAEGFAFAETRLGKLLPPTCRNATRFDSYIFHPFLAERILDMWVGPEHLFADHSPIYTKFQFEQTPSTAPSLFIPEDWSIFPLDTDVFRTQYISQASKTKLRHIISSTTAPHTLLRQWSDTIEKAVHSTLQIQHAKDPIRHPATGLAKKFRGRCASPRFVSTPEPRTAVRDITGAYDPPGEPTSLRSCLKIRQTRRLASLHRQLTKLITLHLRWEAIPVEKCRYLQLEWDRICKAQGYGKSWQHWILSFDSVRFLPSSVPDEIYLQLLLQITQYDANLAVRQEEKMRRTSRKHRISMDMADKNGSLIFRSLRDPEQKMISGMPCTLLIEAKRIRLSKGSTRLLLTDDAIFRLGPARFAGIDIQIIAQDQRLLKIVTASTDIPVRGHLSQSQYTEEITTLSTHFFNYWMPMWGRDSGAESQSEDSWSESFQEILQHVPQQEPLCITWNDPFHIQATIHKMKPYKAPGADGWRAQELKILPFDALQDLANIFDRLWPHQFTEDQMLARVILLAKVPSPESFSDGRPITILGYIPRLSSKMIADQCLQAWGQSWNPQIAGGLPFRSVKDITIQQQFLLEKAHKSNTPQGGFTLDLVKAFNLIPRQVAKKLLVHMGLSEFIVDFWIKSLNNMQRVLQIRGKCGTRLPSTTGVPEGDALSVCAMLAIAACFFHRMSFCRVTPFTYADNWTFMSSSQRSLFRAFTQMLNFTSALRMKVDLKKSWGWGTHKEMRAFWQNIDILFPAQEINIPVKIASKDLGCMMQYTRKTLLGCFTERIKAAGRRLHRLGKTHIPIHDKAAKIQVAVWPLAFYGAESQLLGDAHFKLLRRQATDALIGHHKFASPYLAMHIISEQVEDPLLYVIATGLCSLRRLFYYHPTMASEMWQEICTPSTSYGPCAAMAGYLARVGWKPQGLSDVVMPCGNQVSLQHQSTREIRKILRQAWSGYVHTQTAHRKGITAMPCDVFIQHRIHRHLSDRTLRLILLDLVGGYQTGTVKAIWDSTQSDKCEFCGAIDNHMHRQLQCPDFAHLRTDHPQAVNSLESHPNLLWLPLATIHPQQVVYNRLKWCRAGPFLDHPDIRLTAHNEFYTDGTCDLPREQNCCRAAWSVVQKVAHDTRDPSLDHFVVSQTSHTKGPQTINRSELEAVVWLIEYFHRHFPEAKVSIYTDSSFVKRSIEVLTSGSSIPHISRLAHFDLFRRLQVAWNPLFHQVFKVKSHRNIEDATGVDDLYTILGNFAADEAAKIINAQEMPALQAACQDIRTHSKQQTQVLAHLYAYLADLNSLHSKLKQEKEKRAAETHAYNALEEVTKYQEVLMKWNIEANFWQFDSPLETIIAQACPAGAHTAVRVWSFMKKLKWHHPDQTRLPQDWGISWYELVIAFQLDTGFALPIWIYHKGEKLPKPYPFLSEEAQIQKPESRSLWHQANTLRAVVRYLENTLQQPLFPKYKKSGASSLVRMGYHKSLVGGISSRPVLPDPAAVIEIVKNYSSQPTQSYPHHVRLELSPIPHTMPLIPECTEIPFQDRNGLYQRIKKCLRNKHSIADIVVNN